MPPVCHSQASLLSHLFVGSSYWVPITFVSRSPTTLPIHVAFPGISRCCPLRAKSVRSPIDWPGFSLPMLTGHKLSVPLLPPPLVFALPLQPTLPLHILSSVISVPEFVTLCVVPWIIDLFPMTFRTTSEGITLGANMNPVNDLVYLVWILPLQVVFVILFSKVPERGSGGYGFNVCRGTNVRVNSSGEHPPTGQNPDIWYKMSPAGPGICQQKLPAGPDIWRIFSKFRGLPEGGGCSRLELTRT